MSDAVDRRSINDLDNASTLEDDDLLVLWQDATDTAKNMTGAQFAAWLVSLAEGHGGIESFVVVDSGTAGNGRLHTATLTYAGDHSTYSFSWRDGYKGDTGPQTYVHILYADKQPTSDADMGVTPDSWIGIYVGTEIDDPDDLHYTDLTWYQFKGPKGDGAAATALVRREGLTKYYKMYTEAGDECGSFEVVDGSGNVSTVSGIGPDGNGDVPQIVGSVSDLGLTSGYALIAEAYPALQMRQVLICPATDFAVSELPLVGGTRQTDGVIEIVRGENTDGWIEYHGRAGGSYRMYFGSSGPSGKWLGACDLLWTNPAPTSSFSSQTVAVDLTGYDFVMVIAYESTSADVEMSTTIRNAVGVKGRLFLMANSRQFRAIEIASTGVTFGVGRSGAVGTNAVEDNAAAVPVYIYGISK